MANKYIRPTPFMTLLIIVSALAAFTLLCAVIASWIRLHLFVVVFCLPVLLAMAFHFGMSMTKHVLHSNHSMFAREIVSKTANQLERLRDSLLHPFNDTQAMYPSRRALKS